MKTIAYNQRKPNYQPPQIITYTDTQLLEELGPARAGTSNGGCATYEDFGKTFCGSDKSTNSTSSSGW